MKNCPNTTCQNHTGTPKNWYVKNGYYKPKSTNQKKPKINQELFKLLVSGVSLRRASQILGVEYNTVVAQFNYLADVVRLEHHKHLKTIQTTFVQVDEMETYLHARAKPLSVPLVVRVKTGEILGFSVAKMPAKGLLAQIGVAKYQWYDDERSKKFQSMLVGIKH